MGRNRKYQSAAVRFRPALWALVICMALGGMALGYVWQKSQINRLSQQLKQREQRLLELREAGEKLRRQLAIQQSPPLIDRRVRELNLGLVPPAPGQVLRLLEPEPDPPPAPAAPTPYAAGRPGEDGPP